MSTRRNFDGKSDKKNKTNDEKSSFGKRNNTSSAGRRDDKPRGKFDDKKRYNDGEKSFDRNDRGEKKFDGKRSFNDRNNSDRKPFDRDRKPYKSDRREDFNREEGKPYNNDRKSFDKDKKPYNNDRKESGFNKEGRKPYNRENKPFDRDRKPFDRDRKPYSSDRKESGNGKSFERSKKDDFRPRSSEPYKDFRNGRPKPKNDEFSLNKSEREGIRLNKYIANSGICSRREADELIKTGVVTVNNKVITEMGYKVLPGDIVHYGGDKLSSEKPVYLLLNKPKNHITTTNDPGNRKTVMHLIDGACKERIYPVGRLDRNTLGVLLFTNDGEMAKKLLHPKHKVKKIYHVTLDKSVKMGDLKKLIDGLELEDGFAKADVAAYIEGSKSKKEVGIEIHIGKNRIVRRMFQSLGYEVVKLDRVYFAGLTKKNLTRGQWRFLDKKEIDMLHMI